MSKIKILQWVLGLVVLAALAGIVVDTCCDPEKPAGPSGPPEPQSDKTFPRVVTLDQTNIIHDIKQDKTLRAIGPLFAEAMRGKTPRARAGKGLLGIGVLALSTWLHHKADENRKEAEEIRRRRANEDKTPTIAPAIKGFGLHQGGTDSVLSVICGRDGARPSQ